jgi:hypothetical protein
MDHLRLHNNFQGIFKNVCWLVQLSSLDVLARLIVLAMLLHQYLAMVFSRHSSSLSLCFGDKFFKII